MDRRIAITEGRAANARCIACDAPLVCEPAGDCWCKHEDVRLPMPAADAPAGCYCAACLRARAR